MAADTEITIDLDKLRAVLRDVGEVIAGLQVPISVGGRLNVGAAFEPWQRLRQQAGHGFGWFKADEITDGLLRAIEARE